MKRSEGISTLSTILWMGILYVMVFLVMTVPALLLDGWAITKLWAWFVIPTFSSAPPLHLAAAIGISMLTGFLTRVYRYDYKPESEKVKNLVGTAAFLYLGPLLIVFLGWIVQAWA